MNKLIKILMISFTSLFFTASAFAADVTMRISLQLPMKSHLGQNLLLFKKKLKVDQMEKLTLKFTTQRNFIKIKRCLQQLVLDRLNQVWRH